MANNKISVERVIQIPDHKKKSASIAIITHKANEIIQNLINSLKKNKNIIKNTSFNKTFLMEIYIKLFEVLFPVFFIVGIGYYLGRKNPKLDTTFITNFQEILVLLQYLFLQLHHLVLTYSVFKEYFIYYLIAITSFI